MTIFFKFFCPVQKKKKNYFICLIYQMMDGIKNYNWSYFILKIPRFEIKDYSRLLSLSL